MNGSERIIEELRALVAEQAARLEEQAARLEEQAARIAELELALAKAKKDSSTSSKPPSSDLVKPKPKNKKPGRRKKPRRGAQPGHEQHLREPLPPDRVDEIVEYEIDDDEVQRLGLTPTGDFETIQHIELPETPIHVTEHQLAVYRDADGQMYIPDCPELKGQIFGPRLLATIGWLKSVGHCSYSTVEAWMEDVLQVPVSRGYLAKICTGTISASLAESYKELVEAIPHQEQLGSDETGIKDNGKKHWIWCITAATFSVFHIAASRSREVLEKLVGPDFAGYLNFDYFSANCSFAWNNWIKAQYCWAHLIRDIRFLAEKHPDKKTKAWAETLLDRSRRLFSAWHRRDEMTAEGFHRSMLTHRDRFLELVRQPPKTKEAANLAARFKIVEYREEGSDQIRTYDCSEDYFRFMFAERVEPTNNHNEQQLRHSVIDRRITQGTRGEAGQRYHERMWTAIATCKKQNRNFFTFLYKSVTAQLQNQPGPSLLRV
jgi:transposase